MKLKLAIVVVFVVVTLAPLGRAQDVPTFKAQTHSAIIWGEDSGNGISQSSFTSDPISGQRTPTERRGIVCQIHGCPAIFEAAHSHGRHARFIRLPW